MSDVSEETSTRKTSVGRRNVMRCTQCSFVAVDNRAHFLEHWRTHEGEKPFSCPECPYQTADPSHLKRHLRIHTGEKPYSCPHCSYRSSENAKVWLASERPEERGPHPETETLHQIPLESFIVSGPIDTAGSPHNASSARKFFCAQCSYSTAVKGNMARHVQIHTGEKPFACPLCPYRSHEKPKIKRHMKIHLM
ncbi:Gastrula zinc finger protein XlCGF57.1 [Portunus trituberculatus]|uniref:Gastrula zinc finger protein XlCGF57.1 n=1 Tax=Portunus trituberculatus TaxID=210409 RepID=A0A5B7CLP1_PORTR|nr:Gastrula zinc finger protein XlCGF57.1 [Portunus trituberculatus]